jgi:hypothetical protein
MLRKLGFYSTEERPECGKPVSLTVLKNAAVRLKAYIEKEGEIPEDTPES